MKFDKIPSELTSLQQWVCVWSNSKIPMQATIKKGASSSQADTWSAFEDAKAAVENECYDNIGFVFNNNGIVGIDIDCGYDEDGFLSGTARDIITECRSYTEKSRSGRGMHIYVKGELPFSGKNNKKGVEIYQSNRYFIVTGEKLIFERIIKNQDAIDYVLDKYFPDNLRESQNSPTDGKIYTPIYDIPTAERIPLQPVYPTIAQGMRNISLLSLAGQLHNQGYNKEAIYRELLKANTEACKPPLPISEIQSITNSIVRYRRTTE